VTGKVSDHLPMSILVAKSTPEGIRSTTWHHGNSSSNSSLLHKKASIVSVGAQQDLYLGQPKAGSEALARSPRNFGKVCNEGGDNVREEKIWGSDRAPAVELGHRMGSAERRHRRHGSRHFGCDHT